MATKQRGGGISFTPTKKVGCGCYIKEGRGRKKVRPGSRGAVDLF